MSFYENFVRQCNKVGKTPSKVAQEANISKSIVSRWKHGGGVTDATAMKLAEYFGVSVQELTEEATAGDLLYEATRDHGLVQSPFKKENPTATTDGRISDSKRRLLELAWDLPEDQAKLLLRQAELLLQLMDVQAGDKQQ